jgi:hypothetical protein
MSSGHVSDIVNPPLMTLSRHRGFVRAPRLCLGEPDYSPPPR